MRQHDLILLDKNAWGACVYIGPHVHIMETILTLMKAPYKCQNTYAIPINHRQLSYRVTRTIDHTPQNNIGDKTSSWM